MHLEFVLLGLYGDKSRSGDFQLKITHKSKIAIFYILESF